MASNSRNDAKLLKAYRALFKEKKEDQAFWYEVAKDSRTRRDDYTGLIVKLTGRVIKESCQPPSDLYKLLATAAVIAVALMGSILMLEHYLIL